MEIMDNLDPLLKTFWFVAIPTSIFFLLQTIMTFVGADASDGISADFDGDLEGGDAPFQLFSLRNLVNFLLGFSWTGIAFYPTVTSPALLISLAFIVGASFVYLFFMIIRQVQKLAEDNSFKLSNTINKTAEVYLTIPGNKKGKGKVLVSVKGSVHELDAVTDDDKLDSGAVVKVIKIESDNILLVKSI